MERRYLTIRELVEYIGISERTIYRWIHDRKIPFSKVGFLLRFDRFKIDKWINQYEQQAEREELLKSSCHGHNFSYNNDIAEAVIQKGG